MDFIDGEVPFNDKLIQPNYSRNIQERSVFSWTITLRQFQRCQQHLDLAKQCIRSPRFPQDCDAIFKWRLELYPYETGNDTETRYSSIFLSINKTSEIVIKVHAKCHIVLRTKHDEVHTIIDNFYIRNQEEMYGDWKFIETELLESQLLDGPAKIDVFLSVNDESNNYYKNKFHSMTKLCNNYLSLLNNSTFSDVTICTKDTKFKVHSNILAARSNVFAAMLTDEMMESRTKSITIEDCSDTTMNDLLNFIYGCKVQFRSIEETLDLLKVSDKYELLDLKTQCLEYLSAVTDTENACNLFLIAEDYDLPELKASLLEFVQKNKTKFKNSSFFAEILAKKPQLLIDITTNLLGDTENTNAET